jgi:regulator of ribosome biosynthesis
LERQLKLTRTSTASLGKYDKKLDGEATREKGLRRQFESNEIDTSTEREKYLAVLNGLDNDEKVKKRIKGLSEHSDVLNARKAIRSASKGKGSASLAGEEKRNKIKDKKAALGKLSNKSSSGSSSSSSKASKSSKGGGGAGKTKSSATKGKRKGK